MEKWTVVRLTTKGVLVAVKVAVIYYSATCNVYKLAREIEEGAKEAGAEVRLRKVRELAPEEAIRSNQGWHDHVMETEDVPEAQLEDLEWADAYIFGTPTRFGNVSAQLKQFLDTTGGCGSRASSRTRSSAVSPARRTLTVGRSPRCSPCNVFMHWGAIIVPTCYTSRRSSRPVAIPMA